MKLMLFLVLASYIVLESGGNPSPLGTTDAEKITYRYDFKCEADSVCDSNGRPCTGGCPEGYSCQKQYDSAGNHERISRCKVHVPCSQNCKNCISGGASDGGKPISNGVCKHFCSKQGFCGSGAGYKTGDNCDDCRNQGSSNPETNPKGYDIDCTGKRNYQESMDYCRRNGCTIASFHSQEDIIKVRNKIRCTAYIGASSNGKGDWTYADGSEWWQYTRNDGLSGTEETKIAWHTDGKWHDWGTGDEKLGVICKCQNA